MLRIFFSYCHADEGLRDELEKHLAGLKKRGLIENWHDRRINAGDVFDQEISYHLEEADIVLFLVSADFMASNYCWNVEMKRALERHREGSATVIPVILRACDWMDDEFAKLMATPTDGKPVMQWADKDEAFLDIVKSIKTVITRNNQQQTNQMAAQTINAATIEAAPIPTVIPASEAQRSSNLRLKKTFNDRDRDAFLHDSFEYIVNFIRNSLEELSARNAHIDGILRRTSNDSFNVIIYDQGNEISSCRIFIGGIGTKSICYGHNAPGQGNGFNENLTIEHDDQNLYLNAMMPSFGFDVWNKKKLTQEGASEYYWSRLIEPLQR